MVDVVYMDEANFNLHWICRFGRARRGQRCQQTRPTERGQNLSLVVAVGHEGVIAHNVTLRAYNSNKFLEFSQTKVIPSLDRRRFMDNVPFHKFCNIPQAFEDIGYISLLLFAIILSISPC